MNIVSLSTKNLKRKITRTVILIATVTVVMGTLFSATLFISSMQNALRIGTYRLGADVLVVPQQYESQARSVLLSGQPTTFFMNSSILDQVKKIDGVKKASPQLFIKPASFTCCFNVDVSLVAFDPKTDFTINPWLESHIKKTLQDNQIITGREVPVITGDSLPFFGSMFTVAGTMEPTGMKFFDTSVFMTMDAAYKMAAASKAKSLQPLSIPKGSISAILVQVSEDYTPDRVAIRLEHDIPGIKAITSDEVISQVRKQLKGLFKGIIAISVILWIVVLLMMGFAFSIIINERQRELGLLRAMGAKKSQIFRLILSEAAMVSTTGGIFGLICGATLITSFHQYIIHSLKMPYLLPSNLTLIILIIGSLVFSHLTGILSALLPALNAMRMEPYEAIRKGE